MTAVLETLKQSALPIIELVVLLVIAVIQVVKYGKVSKEVKQDLKYRLENYQQTEQVKAQEFSPLVPEYKLDENTGELVQVGEKDIQALVQSSVECALEKILEKYNSLPLEMQAQVPTTDTVNVVSMQDDLDYLMEQFGEFEELRKKYGFSDDMSYSDMFRQISAQKVQVEAQIQKLQGGAVNEKAQDEAQG